MFNTIRFRFEDGFPLNGGDAALLEKNLELGILVEDGFIFKIFEIGLDRRIQDEQGTQEGQGENAGIPQRQFDLEVVAQSAKVI